MATSKAHSNTLNFLNFMFMCLSRLVTKVVVSPYERLIVSSITCIPLLQLHVWILHKLLFHW